MKSDVEKPGNKGERNETKRRNSTNVGAGTQAESLKQLKENIASIPVNQVELFTHSCMSSSSLSIGDQKTH